MRIVFMGNPGFALPSLSAIHHSSHEVIAVVTNPDKQQGRGRRSRPTPVASLARDHGLLLLQPETLKDDTLVRDLEAVNADLFVIVAFKILPHRLLRIPRLGSVNLHGSLLPHYRGAAPIQWALINGDSLTGLTTFMLAPEVDTGNVLLKREIVIYPDDDYGSLSRRMAHLGASLLLETVDGMERGDLTQTPQDDSLATRAPKIKAHMCKIDWLRSARDVSNMVKALAPVPGAYSSVRGKRLKIFRTRIAGIAGGAPGQIASVGKASFVVSCGKRALEVLDVQLEGKRRMAAGDFARGFGLTVGEVLGSQD